MKIVRLSKDSNLTRIAKVFKWFRFSGRGPEGTIAKLNTLTAKVTPVDADMALIGDSAASFENKSITFANLWVWIKSKADLVYALISSTFPHGTISGPINLSALFTEHTGDFAASFTLTLTDFTEALNSSVFYFTVSGGGAPTVTVSSTPAAEFWSTQTLSALDDGDYTALFIFDGTNYDVRVQKKP